MSQILDNYSIYCIRNNHNGKLYYGQTSNIKTRFSKYKNLQCKSQPKIYNAIKKYGWSGFTATVIVIGLSKESADLYEEFLIIAMNTIHEGYNCKGGGSNGKFSIESRQKMSKAQTGKPSNMSGKHHSEETKIKISKSRKGQRISEETKIKMRESHRKRIKF